MLEAEFQKRVINEIRLEFPDAIIMKNDASYLLGIPDITILNESRWAFLELKQYEQAKHQALQDDYIAYAQTYAFGAFVYPDNWPVVKHMLFDYLEDGY